MTKNLLILVVCFLTASIITACVGTGELIVQPASNPEQEADPTAMSTNTPQIPSQATESPLPNEPPSPLVKTTQPFSTPTPSPSPSPNPAYWPCWQDGGHFENDSLAVPELREPLEFRVYLPPCYQADTERRYPVLYLLHGQSYSDDQWERLGAGEFANKLIAEGEIPPFLIVMPRYRLWSDPDTNHFGTALVEHVVPWIDSRYRTLPDRDARAVGGLSKGAGWAVHLGLTQWDVFSAIGGHSLAVFWSDTYQIRSWIQAIPPEKLPRIYLDIGDKDRPEIMSSAIWFEEILTYYNIPHEWYLLTGYHEEAYWSGNMERYLRWYSKDWEKSP